MPAIGFVTKQHDGSYRGELKTLTIHTSIEIRPNPREPDDRQPDFRIYVSNNVEIGSARKKIGKGSEAEYIALSIAAPEFGPRTLKVNLGRAAGQENPNVFAMIWNPED
jgi:uncharacterized protein (DUF736 family)